MPAHHDVRSGDVFTRRLHGTLAAAAERGPVDFPELLLTPGVGARTVQSLAMVAEVVHGAPYRFQDPARFSLAHGGKDRHPYPVPIKVYDETIRVLKSAVQKAKLGNTEEMQALRRLDDQARASGTHRERSIPRGLHRYRASAIAILRWPVGVRLGERSCAQAAHRLTRPGMKIATFNINNVNRRLPNLLDWLKSAKPDIVCLQELKCTDAQFPVDAIKQAGYHAVWRGQRTWNGVAILSRGSAPVVTRTSLPGDPKDEQARYIEAAIDGILIGCIYLPNGNPQPGPKFDYKLAWFRRLSAHARKLLQAGRARRAGRRLQCRPHRDRHLSHVVLG